MRKARVENYTAKTMGYVIFLLFRVLHFFVALYLGIPQSFFTRFTILNWNPAHAFAPLTTEYYCIYPQKSLEIRECNTQSVQVYRESEGAENTITQYQFHFSRQRILRISFQDEKLLIDVRINKLCDNCDINLILPSNKITLVLTASIIQIQCFIIQSDKRRN